jgi:hypothetical protein
MKSKILIIIAVVIAIFVGIKFEFKDTCSSKEAIPAFMENKLKSMGIESIDIRHEETIDNKYIIVFTYNNKNNPSLDYIGISAFEIKSHNRYKYENFSGNSFSVRNSTISTTDEKGNHKGYSLFYGVIEDGVPNKYKITHSGKTQIEEISRNEIFFKYN